MFFFFPKNLYLSFFVHPKKKTMANKGFKIKPLKKDFGLKIIISKEYNERVIYSNYIHFNHIITYFL